MGQAEKIWLNGEIVNWDRASVHIASHGLCRASAIFDFMAVYDRAGTPCVFRLEDHVRRFQKTARLLDMNLAQSGEELAEGLLAACRAEGLREGFLKIMAYFSGDGTFALVLDDVPDVAVFAIHPTASRTEMSRPVSACLAPWRKIHPATIPVEAKACANYLNGVLARRVARDRGYDLGLMLDAQGFVAEGAVESFFLVRDGRLATAPLGTVLASVSRQTLIDVAPTLGLEVEETLFTPESVMTADELFFSSSPYRVKPIRNFEGRELEAPGPVSQKLLDFFDDLFTGRETRFADWFTPI